MGCLEEVVKSAVENLPAFLDSVECTVFIENEYEGQKIHTVCSISKDGILEVKGFIVESPQGRTYVSAEETDPKTLKEAELACLTELKLVIEKLKKNT